MPFHILQLDSGPGSLAMLRAFYTELYTAEFPDADERESLANMENYLRLKEQGWYGSNNYHIIMALDEDHRVVGGGIADYLAGPNVGIVEFIVIQPSLRGRGLGRQLLAELATSFTQDSLRAGHAALSGICGEVNDPYRRCEVEEHLDGFARLRMWHRFGFRLLDFPYVQPPLSEHQAAVTGIALMFQPLQHDLTDALPSNLVEQIVREFQIWAMRIPNPDEQPVFVAMRDHLRTRAAIPLLDMAAYIGEAAPAAFILFPLQESDPRLPEFAALYQQEFHHDTTAVDVTAFSCGTHHDNSSVVPYHYWLWGLDPASGGGLAGFASFFSFPHCGFGGYLAFTRPLRGHGHFRLLLRLLERQIVESNPRISGWYVECEPASLESSVFRHCGFTQVPMTYLQPRLHTDPLGVSESKQLDLLFKPLGRRYHKPVLSLAHLRRDVSEILTVVYRLTPQALEDSLERMTWPACADDVFTPSHEHRRDQS